MWFIADIFQRYTTSFANAFAKIAAAEADATRRALDSLRARRDRSSELIDTQDRVPLQDRVHPQIDPEALAAATAAEAVLPEPAAAEPSASEPVPLAAAAPEEAVVLAEAEVEAVTMDQVEPDVAPAIAEESLAAIEAAPVEAAPETPAAAELVPLEADGMPLQTVTAEALVPAAIPMGVRGDVVVRWVQAFADAERREMPDLLEALRKDKKVRVPELQIICAEVLGEPPQHRKKNEHLDVLRRHFVPSDRARLSLGSDAQLAAN